MIKTDFNFKSINGTAFFTSTLIEKNNNIRHFFSTRIGGVSKGAFESLNLGVYSNDNRKNIKSNFDIILKASGMDNEKVVYLNQIHGSEFYVVDEQNYKDIIGADGDALITCEKGIAIGVLTADCVPIIAVDPIKNIVSAIHAGWKGTYNKISYKVLQYMIENMGSSPENIITAIGPSIGPCCFKVGKDVADKFKYVSFKDDSYFVDLWQENKSQILNCGIKQYNIDLSNLCTMCSCELFYSYRKEKGITGRMGTFIQMI